MLTGPFSEANALRDHGKVTIRLVDDNAHLFLMVMHILYAETAELPDSIDFHTLFGFSKLVNKYELEEATKGQVARWIDTVQPPMPTFFSWRMHSWIWISLVFNMKDEFKTLTGIAQKQSKGPIGGGDPYNAPLPAWVIG